MTISAQPLVSIVIPCYNQGRFLAEAIESAQRQTHPHIEIVVVDDGSTDQTATITQRYSAVTCVAQSNAGAAAARNAGLEKSRGEHVIFLDADDRLLPHAAALGVDYLSVYQDRAFVSGHVRLIAEDGSDRGVPPQIHAEGGGYRELLLENYIWTPGAVMYRRSALELVGGFDPAAGGSADFELNLRLARRFAYGCHHQVVLEYRRHSMSTSADAAGMLRSAVTVRRRQRRFIRGDRSATDAWRRGIATVQADFGGRVVEQIASDLVQRHMFNAVRGLRCLLAYHRAGLWQLVRASLRRLSKASSRPAMTREQVARRG